MNTWIVAISPGAPPAPVSPGAPPAQVRFPGQNFLASVQPYSVRTLIDIARTMERIPGSHTRARPLCMVCDPSDVILWINTPLDTKNFKRQR